MRAELAKGPHAGLSVGVLHGGMRWVRGYGLRDLAHKLPATPRTTYRMASITKSFTAVAVMQLVQEGKLQLDADLRSVVPEYPEKQWTFTVRQLLGHLGGVPHYDGPEAAENTQPLDTAGALALFADKPLAAEPGTKFVYTTWGYNLLGAAVEKASGRGYGRYLKAQVFGPAGMRHAALDDQRTRDKHHAVGYRPHKGQLVPSHFLDVSSRFAGGGTRASVEDLLAFGRAMLQHRAGDRGDGADDADLHEHPRGPAHRLRPGLRHLPAARPLHGGARRRPAGDDLAAGDAARRGRRHRDRQQPGGRGEAAAAHLHPHPRDAAGGRARPPRRAPGGPGGRRGVRGAGPPLHLRAGLPPVGHPRAGRAPQPGDLPEAFTRMSALLDRASIAQDPQAALQRVRAAHHPARARSSSAWARTWPDAGEDAGAREAPRVPRRGPLAFFTDYLAACEQVPCPAPLRFSEPLQKDARHFDEVWQRSRVAELRRVRLDEVKDPEALWPALEAATANTSLHPDYVDEMLRVAGLLGKRGKKEEQLRWLERTVALHPQSAPAREALAKVQAPGTQEPLEVPTATAPRRATDGSSPVPDDAGLLPASRPAPPPPQERAAEQGD